MAIVWTVQMPLRNVHAKLHGKVNTTVVVFGRRDKLEFGRLTSLICQLLVQHRLMASSANYRCCCESRQLVARRINLVKIMSLSNQNFGFDKQINQAIRASLCSTKSSLASRCNVYRTIALVLIVFIIMILAHEKLQVRVTMVPALCTFR